MFCFLDCTHSFGPLKKLIDLFSQFAELMKMEHQRSLACCSIAILEFLFLVESQLSLLSVSLVFISFGGLFSFDAIVMVGYKKRLLNVKVFSFNNVGCA